MPARPLPTHRVTGFFPARTVLRARTLRQALYDEGDALMADVIVNLHGADHLARRRLENRLFRRDTFDFYETRRLPQILDETLQPAIERGRGDLAPLARRTMMALSIDVAGVDVGLHPTLDTVGAFELMFELMGRLARASTVAHATGDKRAIIADGNEALARFEAEFFDPARARRAALVERVERGELAEDALPRDVLTTLLRNADDLDLPDDTILREVAYFSWVGSHSTSVQLVHAMHHLFEWIERHPADRHRLRADAGLRQLFVHESLRLHPASPVARRIAVEPTDLGGGAVAAAGDVVVIDIERANRDPAAFGADPDRFDPARRRAERVPPWGLSFGSGMHACLGQELAGGHEPPAGHELAGSHDDGAELDAHLYGAIAIMAGALLDAGARPDPDDRPSVDASTTRPHFGRYPVRFGPG